MYWLLIIFNVYIVFASICILICYHQKNTNINVLCMMLCCLILFSVLYYLFKYYYICFANKLLYIAYLYAKNAYY